jgi:uncharacterized protein (TIRG00374 family)
LKKSFLQTRAWLYLQIVVVVFIFAAMIWYKGDEFKRALTEFDPKYLLLSFLVYFASLILTFLRWQLLVKALDLPFTFFDAIRLGFVGAVASLFMPGSITGDLVKASFIATEQKRRAAAVATIIVDRIIGLYALLVLTSLIGLAFWREVAQFERLRLIVYFVWAVTAGGAAAVAAMYVFRADPFVAWLEKVRFIGRPFADLTRALQCYKHNRPALLATVGLGLVGHLGFVLTFQLAACAVTDAPPPWEILYIIIPAYMVATSVPLTPMGNLGAGEALMGGLFKMVGGKFTDGAALALAQRLVTWAAAAVGLVWYIPLYRDLKRRQHAATALVIEELEEPGPAAMPEAIEP